MSEERVMTGGCQCGRVRSTARVEDLDAILCHCRMCQRATGGVSTPYKNVAHDKLTWDAPADWYKSSPIAHRPFCSACGTPLGFAFLDGGEGVDITVGTFDDPSRFRPTMNYAVESMHQAWLDTSALPRMRTDENEAVTKRWKEACGGSPD